MWFLVRNMCRLIAHPETPNNQNPRILSLESNVGVLWIKVQVQLAWRWKGREAALIYLVPAVLGHLLLLTVLGDGHWHPFLTERRLRLRRTDGHEAGCRKGGGRSLWELPLWLGHCTCSLSSPVIPHNLAVGTTDLMFADEAPGTQGGQEQVASEQRPQLCLPPNSILFLTGPIGR